MKYRLSAYSRNSLGGLHPDLVKVVERAIEITTVDFTVPLEWGGDWENFPDGPHFQLPMSDHPAKPEN